MRNQPTVIVSDEHYYRAADTYDSQEAGRLIGVAGLCQQEAQRLAAAVAS
jgi:hypothetical protein